MLTAQPLRPNSDRPDRIAGRCRSACIPRLFRGLALSAPSDFLRVMSTIGSALSTIIGAAVNRTRVHSRLRVATCRKRSHSVYRTCAHVAGDRQIVLYFGVRRPPPIPLPLEGSDAVGREVLGWTLASNL